MNIVLSSAFVLLFCMDYYAIYNNTIAKNNKLTDKQRAHILSVKASSTLFLLSLYFNYKFVTSNFDTSTYLSALNKQDSFVLELSIYNLIAYFITDCVVGYQKYHKYMCVLSGYAHHIVYTIISIISLFKIEIAPFYILYMIEELPTMFLSSGNYNKNYRRDNAFGITFFLTRILYHIFLTWTFRHNTIFLILGGLSFILHGYWFKNWVTKYVLKKNTKEKKQ